jgi:hypothetical protein
MARSFLNEVFKLVGFDVIEDDILRHLVIARLCQPSSKAGTVDYLKSYFDEDLELHKIYRYLDRLHNTLQEKIQQISVAHTRKILGGQIGLVFYDVTTLYFESVITAMICVKGVSPKTASMHNHRLYLDFWSVGMAIHYRTLFSMERNTGAER